MNPGFLQLPEGRLACWERKGSHPPLVLFHGAGGNSMTWKKFSQELPDQEIVAVDLPGHGNSDRFPNLELKHLAGRLLPALERKISEPFYAGGHSWGGKLAAIMGSLSPEKIKGLVLVDPSPAHKLRVSLDGMTDRMFGGELGPWSSFDNARESAKKLPQYKHWNDEVEEVFRYGLVESPQGEWRARARKEDLEVVIESAIGTDYSAVMATVPQEILLVIASESQHWQKTTNEIVFPRATKVIIESNHWIPLQNPVELAKAIGQWLRKRRNA